MQDYPFIINTYFVIILSFLSFWLTTQHVNYHLVCKKNPRIKNRKLTCTWCADIHYIYESTLLIVRVSIIMCARNEVQSSRWWRYPWIHQFQLDIYLNIFCEIKSVSRYVTSKNLKYHEFSLSHTHTSTMQRLRFLILL